MLLKRTDVSGDSSSLCADVAVTLCYLFFIVGIEDLGYVVRLFHDLNLAAKWKEIGQTLQVKVEGVKRDPKSGLLHVVASWLQGHTSLKDPPPSLKGVVWVIADERGGNNLRSAMHAVRRIKGVC